ncbi:MAG TPA: sensor histidine kinase [Terriglobales bacterium]|nr:sensor histidine kinase [Terriglobales bacterium]
MRQASGDRVQVRAHPVVTASVITGLCVLVLPLSSWAGTSERSLPLLVHADQIRQLTADQAALGYPVRVRGVVTVDVPSPDFFVQDATAGVYVEGSRSVIFNHHFGDLIEVEGITGPGKFAPVIRETTSHVLGRGALPKSRVYLFSELADGQLDSQWVQVRGIVRAVSIDRTSWHETTVAMRVASGGGQLSVRVPIPREQDFSSWIDSEVLLEGVCGSLFNAQRQLTAVLLYVPRLSFVTVEAHADDVPLSSLLTFSPGPGIHHRVRVRGVVAYQQPGQELFLQAAGRGLRVLTEQDTKLNIGEVVDAVGFPAVGESAPVLSDAVLYRVGMQGVLNPLALDIAVPWERYDGALVVTDATLLGSEMNPDGLRLLLQGGALFDATLSPPESARTLASVPLNSRVRVTGICLVQNGGLWSVPQSFRLLLRSPKDLVLLHAPSWWNLHHTLWVLGLTVIVLLVGIAWILVLGRRLREQMGLIRRKIRSGAVLQERNRIARELHDNLEQELAGITMQLDLAVDCFQQAPKVARQALETARDMSRHSMVDARRSVWDLRCHLLEEGDLASALRQTVQTSGSREDVRVDVKVQGIPVRLSSATEMNLLRIGQEAVANAVKHGHSRVVSALLEYEENRVRLCVTDDGRGFRTQDPTPSGHFGLLDMRERAHAMGCILQVESEPGLGTRISIEVPAKVQVTR